MSDQRTRLIIGGALVVAAAAGGIAYRTCKSADSKSPSGSTAAATKQALRTPGVRTPQSRGASSPTPANTQQQQDPNRVRIVFGSNTGTAEQFAKELASDGRRKGFNTEVLEGTSFATDKDDIFGEGAEATGTTPVHFIFIVATYGEGDPTDDFREALAVLQQAAGGKKHSNVRAAIFGLGDRSYKYFCKTATDVESALRSMGVSMIAETGLGDARNEMEVTFEDWRETMWTSLAASMGTTLTSAPLMPELTLVLSAVEGPVPVVAPFPPPTSANEPTKTRPVTATVSVIRELVAPSGVAAGRSIKHVELEIPGNVTYQSGDHCGILPSNPYPVVDAYLARLGVEPEKAKQMLVKLTKEKELRSGAKRAINQLPAEVPLREAFRWYLNLCGVPKRSTLRTCVQYCEDSTERDAFAALLAPSPEANAAFREAATKYRTVLGFLEAFPSCRIPLGHFMESMPPIAPRYFSIASDLLLHKKHIHLTIGLLEGGLCSNMIGNSNVGDAVVMFVRKSTFHLPLRQKDRPVICIGPGTGIAPFIGFFQRRSVWLAKKEKLGPCTLFFGCRRQDEDFIYRNQLEEWLATSAPAAADAAGAETAAATTTNGVLTQLSLAFSRDQHEKVYVQHRIREQAETVIRQLLKEGAYLFICGDASRMAKDVEEELKALLQSIGGLPSEAAAANKLKQLEKEGRYLKDVWAS